MKSGETAGRRKYVQSVIRSVWQVKHVTVAMQSPPHSQPLFDPGASGMNQEWHCNSQNIPEPFHPLALASLNSVAPQQL